MIPESLIPALQGVFPSSLSTSDNEATPNISFISQVFYVNENQVFFYS